MESANSHARHLNALLGNPAVTLDRIAAAIAVGIDRTAPPEFEPLQRLDALADEADGIDDPTDVMGHVFGSLGFVANTNNYYAVENSLLHHVLERRTGNPISLSIVAIEIGRRLGVSLVPVGMPAHFLIGAAPSEGAGPTRWFDSFTAGRELTVADAKAIFDSITPEASEFSSLMLEATPIPFVAGRIVSNLRNAAVRNGDVQSFVAVSELALGLPGADVNDHRALVRALATSGRHDRAAEIFDWLIGNDPANAEQYHSARTVHLAFRN